MNIMPDLKNLKKIASLNQKELVVLSYGLWRVLKEKAALKESELDALIQKVKAQKLR
jgi:hypothetical protein